MSQYSWKKPALAVVLFAVLWLGCRYLLPLLLPFLLGGVIALAAEPLVRLGAEKTEDAPGAGLGDRSHGNTAGALGVGGGFGRCGGSGVGKSCGAVAGSWGYSPPGGGVNAGLAGGSVLPGTGGGSLGFAANCCGDL